ncbi:hypothetical protein HW555_008596 [Spodoptera exigua]|uniref:Uncharacterized protein n=1 Tax=Spodoptera exigua TaxID=7107 RepID=A0A835GCA8_SPOEX|nr:hypothetical protein HW555_008596 [Spodoptera exigua]
MTRAAGTWAAGTWVQIGHNTVWCHNIVVILALMSGAVTVPFCSGKIVCRNDKYRS